MKDKGHFYVSLAKSFIRIAGCISAMFFYGKGLQIIIGSFLLAEILGVAEEIFDKR